LTYHLAKTLHLGFAVPVEAGQGLVGVQGIAIEVIGQEPPVDAPDELPPAQNLTDEALGGGQWDLSAPVGRPCLLDDLSRRNQLEAER